METRNTIQRSLVMDAVQRLHHPTADDVYDYIASHHPTVSRATVYRNLGVLAQNGSLNRVGVSDGADHFDATLSPHYHVRCSLCGAVADVDLPYQEDLASRVRDAHGFVVEGHDILLRGRCPNCLEKGSDN